MANSNTQTAPKMQKLVKSDRRMFSSSDDNAMMKQIQATHAHDGREVDVKPILLIIDDILHRTLPSIDSVINGTHHQVEAVEDKTSQLAAGFDGMLEPFAYIIHKISCEISCKCSGGDAHQTTMVLFNTLSSFSWDAKVVLSLAAFAVNYGQFWLVAQLCNTSPLAKSVAILKQLPDIIENSNSLKPQFDALKKLINAMMDVTRCIIEFNELPIQYISEDTPPMSAAKAHIPTAAYWTIRSIVACASQIASLIGLRHEYTASTTEAWELSSLAHKVNNILEHLRNQLAQCYHHIDEKKHIEHYHNLIRLFETIHIDNIKTLRALIYSKDDLQPLVIGTTKIKANIEVLRRKPVLLLISDLDLSIEEITILDLMYKDPQRQGNQYEVVWIPIVDGRSTPLDEGSKHKFEHYQSMMPWYTVIDPMIIEPAVIKYIKEVWHFAKKPILVALDPQGRVASPNALHMMWIWGNLAFPFNSEKEETLWRQETWTPELLVDSIDGKLVNWIEQRRIICLYGGEDIQWIKKFTAAAKAVANAAEITLEMIYLGKSNARERVRKNNGVIESEKLSDILRDPTFSWFFWARLESMLYSKLQHGKTVENDEIVKEVMTMLSFDGSDAGWAVFSRGINQMARANGETALKGLAEFDEWKEDVAQLEFVPALKKYLLQLHTPHHCNRLILPGINGAILEKVVCAECGRPMEKYFMYRCCTD